MVKVSAPAKINLGLKVLGKMSNGYHKVDMIMQSIDLFDVLHVEKRHDGIINVVCDKNLNCDIQNNIAYKAAAIFMNKFKSNCCGVDISIQKNIPIQAGLAGGSADAAALLTALNVLFETSLSTSELLKTGALLGCDVPFCIMGGAARAKGTGTELVSLPSMPECYIVVLKPDANICTAEAYKKIDGVLHFDYDNRGDLMEEFLKKQDIKKLSQNIFNDFEQVICPEIIKPIKNSFINHGALGSLMTGSGSAVYAIFENENDAQNCIKNMKKTYPDIFLCSPINHGSEVLVLS